MVRGIRALITKHAARTIKNFAKQNSRFTGAWTDEFVEDGEEFLRGAEVQVGSRIVDTAIVAKSILGFPRAAVLCTMPRDFSCTFP